MFFTYYLAYYLGFHVLGLAANIVRLVREIVRRKVGLTWDSTPSTPSTRGRYDALAMRPAEVQHSTANSPCSKPCRPVGVMVGHCGLQRRFMGRVCGLGRVLWGVLWGEERDSADSCSRGGGMCPTRRIFRWGVFGGVRPPWGVSGRAGWVSWWWVSYRAGHGGGGW